MFGKEQKIPKRITTEEFVKRSSEVHGNKYDYSSTDYVEIFEKVDIICPIHGKFQQSANKHLRGQGCNKCSSRCRYDTEGWIEKALTIA